MKLEGSLEGDFAGPELGWSVLCISAGCKEGRWSGPDAPQDYPNDRCAGLVAESHVRMMKRDT